MSSTRAQAILSRAAQHSVSNAERIKTLEPRTVAAALAHSSMYVRTPLLTDINASDCNRLAIVRALIELLSSKDDLQPYQSVSAAFASLAAIDTRAKSAALPQLLHDALVDVFVHYLVGRDETHVNETVRAVTAMSLSKHVVLRLLDWLDANCQSASVYRALRAMRLIDVATPEIILRVLASMHHFSPSALVRLESGSPEPACLDAAADFLLGAPEVSYTNKVRCSTNGNRIYYSFLMFAVVVAVGVGDVGHIAEEAACVRHQEPCTHTAQAIRQHPACHAAEQVCLAHQEIPAGPGGVCPHLTVFLFVTSHLTTHTMHTAIPSAVKPPL